MFDEALERSLLKMSWFKLLLVSVISPTVLMLPKARAEETSSGVTFYKDALPIFQEKCAACHRPGQVAPMSLLSYETARPWAKAIKAAILTRKMPPGQGFSGAHFNRQRERMTLSSSQIATLTSWVDGGAPEGRAKDAPAPVSFRKDGWTIRPDIVFESPVEYQIPARGVIPNTNYVVPYKFEKDTYIAETEMIPQDPSHTHHYMVYLVPPGPYADLLGKWDVKKPLPFVPPSQSGFGKGIDKNSLPGSPESMQFVLDWAPGQGPQYFDTADSAMFVPAGSRLVISVHYTADGKASHDRAKGAIQILDHKPKNEVYTLAETGPSQDTVIPPGATVRGESHMLITRDIQVAWLDPHMHLRGKNWKITLTYPDGRKEVMLDVPHYDFNWQIVYVPDEPFTIPAGTRWDAVGDWDNSASNPTNPDPSARVIMGLQSWEEMWGSFFFYYVPLDADPNTVAVQASKTD
jgi:hypothetical protein